MASIISSTIILEGKPCVVSAGFLSLDEVFTSALMACYDTYRWLYVIEGSGTAIEEDSKSRYQLKSGALFFRLPNHFHSIVRNEAEPWKEFFISIPEELFCHLVTLGVINPETFFCFPGNGRQMTTAIQRFCASLNENRSNASVLSALISLFSTVQLLTEKTSIDNQQHDILTQSVQIMRHNPSISLKELSDKLNVCSDHFCRFFQKKFGTTPKRYMIEQRINMAKALLRESTLSIEEIAETLAYSDRFSFSKQFKKYVNLSPGSFRACPQ